MEFVTKVLVFMVRLALAIFPCCVSRIKRRIAQIREACGGPNQEKTLVIGKTATVQIEQIESLSIESSIVREWLLHPKCPS